MADRFLKPMLAKDNGLKPPVVPTGPEWILEPKLDGWRFLWERTPAGVSAIGGRNGRDHTGEAPEVEEALMVLPVGTIVDSERIEGQSRVYQAFMFDLLMLGPHDLTGRPWDERRELLEGLAEIVDEELCPLVPVVDPATQEAHDAWFDAGLEGSVAKKRKSRYRPGARSSEWIKNKPQATTEAVVTGYVMGKGQTNTDRVGALEVTLLESGQPTTTGHDCSIEEAEAMIGKTLELRHHGWTVHRKVRHPVFYRWRPDRDQVAA